MMIEKVVPAQKAIKWATLIRPDHWQCRHRQRRVSLDLGGGRIFAECRYYWFQAVEVRRFPGSELY